jgi:hypothetical protein
MAKRRQPRPRVRRPLVTPEEAEKRAQTQMPDTTKQENLLAVARAGINLIPVPVLAPMANELLTRIVAPIIGRKQVEFLNGLALRAYQHRADFDRYVSQDEERHEAFASAVVQGLQIAQKTREREKMEQLQNAALNIALGPSSDADLQLSLMNTLGLLTPCEVTVLAFIHDPRVFGAELSSQRVDIAGLEYRDAALSHVHCLQGDAEAYEYFVQDLASHSLIVPPSRIEGNVAVTWVRSMPEMTTMGEALLSLIRSPLPEQPPPADLGN